MKELIFSVIYLVLGVSLASAYYFHLGKEIFGLLTVLYLVILLADYTND